MDRDGGGGVLPMSAALTLDRKGVSVGIVAAINLVSRALAPTSVYIARVTGAHQPWFGWTPPIRARVRGPFDPLGLNGIEINLTFSPLISTLLLNLYFLVYLCHHILVHRACFIITAQLPIESFSYNIRFVQKQILFLLGLSRNHKAFP